MFHLQQNVIIIFVAYLETSLQLSMLIMLIKQLIDRIYVLAYAFLPFYNYNCYSFNFQAPTLIITTTQLEMDKPGMPVKGTVVRLLSLVINFKIILIFLRKEAYVYMYTMGVVVS